MGILVILAILALLAGFLHISGLIIGIGLIIITIIVTGIQTSIVFAYKLDILKIKKDIKVAQEQYETQSAIIKDIVKEYPMEENLLKNFNPEILLTLPEIKSNELIASQIKIALQYKNNIYEYKYRVNRIERDLDFHKNKFFSFSLISPSYQEEDLKKFSK